MISYAKEQVEYIEHLQKEISTLLYEITVFDLTRPLRQNKFKMIDRYVTTIETASQLTIEDEYYLTKKRLRKYLDRYRDSPDWEQVLEDTKETLQVMKLEKLVRYAR